MGWKTELWPEWEIVQDIGAGAFGTVYKIKRQDLGGTYYAALKVISVPSSREEINQLRGQKLSDGQIREFYDELATKICTEISVMERLKGYTNIVSYEDHKIVPHRNGIGRDILIRMELLTSLPQYMQRHTMDEKEVCRLGIDICNALSICHRSRIIHRDIKPGNIFVSEYGDFKLGDFGLARHIRGSGYATARRGTYYYMAPEVYDGDGYSFNIDIYSLGLILYRMMNRGRGPFLPLPPEPITEAMAERANRKRMYADVLPKPADASSMMAGILLKACAGDPGRRYASVEEFRSALQRCMASQSALNAEKKISGMIKRAATRLMEDMDLDAETEPVGYGKGTPDSPVYENDSTYMSLHVEKMKKMAPVEENPTSDTTYPGAEPVKTEVPFVRVNRDEQEQKMSNFFSAAGDL